VTGWQEAAVKLGVAAQKSRSLLVQEIQKLGLSDIERMLLLNNANASETSLLNTSDMIGLLNKAFYCKGIDRGVTALLIALDHNALYDNPNFNWFKQRRNSFVYIDRIIVSDIARGQGLARRLYQDFFAEARLAGHDRVVCEVNIYPPNPASNVFHDAMGFVEIGRAAIHNETKVVRYFEKAFE
jgi:predicted GNAT superfamily acetyltransferase